MSRGASTAAGGAGALAVSDVALVVGRVEVDTVPAGGEDDGLTDHLALGVRGNGDSVSSGARRTTHEGTLVGRCPASMADVALGDFAVVGVGGGSSKHTETLQSIRPIALIHFQTSLPS